MGRSLTVTPKDNVQAALNSLRPGDELLLADGTYAGGLKVQHAGTRQAPITVRAVNPRKAIFDGADRDGIAFTRCDWWIVKDLVFRNAKRCGVYVAESQHFTLSGCLATSNGGQGILFGECPDAVIEDNEASYTAAQHGIYFSDAADRPIIRRNTCHHNGRAGIQLNGGGAVVAAAGEKADGKITGALVEYNIIYANGNGRMDGGTPVAAGINLLQVCSSVIQHNTLYDNLAGGIALANYSCDNRLEENSIRFPAGRGGNCLSARNHCMGNTYVGGVYLAGRNVPTIDFDPSSSLTHDPPVKAPVLTGAKAGAS